MARPAVVVTAVSVVLVIVVLALARYPSWRVAPGAGNTQLDAPAPSVQVAAAQPDARPAPLAAPPPVAAPDAQVPQVVIEKPRQTRVVTTKKRPPANNVSVPTAAEAVASGAGESAAKTVVHEPTMTASGADSNQTPDPVSRAPVTITGCLETSIDGDRFRLTDTEGADAPKARSWRSGFLKKRPAPVELVELHDLRDLQKLVGHRVAATGLLTSRALRVRSLESTGSACN